jgi:hypothetical protein
MTWTSQHLLNAVAQAASDDCITETRMAELTGMKPIQVERSAFKLRQHGFMTRVGQGCHQLTPAGRAAYEAGIKLTSGPTGPQASGQRKRHPGLRQRVWNVLRLGRKVSVEDILLLVVQGGEKDPTSNVGKYLRALARAGYVRRMPIRETPSNLTSNGAIRWWLISDTGALAPVWRTSRDVIHDPNLDQDIPMVRDLVNVRRGRPACHAG